MPAYERMSLCETLDRVLNKGVVIVGHLIISVADIDLVYIGLNVLVSSVETMQGTYKAAAVPCLAAKAAEQ
jgi:hypothetical protein